LSLQKISPINLGFFAKEAEIQKYFFYLPKNDAKDNVTSNLFNLRVISNFTALAVNK